MAVGDSDNPVPEVPSGGVGWTAGWTRPHRSIHECAHAWVTYAFALHALTTGATTYLDVLRGLSEAASQYLR